MGGVLMSSTGMRAFENRVDCEDALAEQLGFSADDGIAAEGLMDALLKSCEPPPNELVGCATMTIGLGRWIIRDEDLKLFATFKEVVLPLAAVGYSMYGLTSAAATAILFSVL